MVFATHERRPIITPNLEPQLYAYMAGTVRGLGCHLHALNGVEDHCHLVFDLARTITVADFTNKLKAGATKWARDNGHPDFAWQRGYGAFSMNQESLDRAVRYVRSQKDHHKKTTLHEELAEFMRLHGMEADTEFIDGAYRPVGDDG
jgi:REP element-mobilizing transposase RayT